jgi:hypothetical protein
MKFAFGQVRTVRPRCAARCLLFAGLLGTMAIPPIAGVAAAETIRVGVVGTAAEVRPWREALAAQLGRTAAVEWQVVAIAPEAGANVNLASLRESQVAMFLRGPGMMSAVDVARLREFLGSGQGCVVLGATTEAWSAAPDLLEELIGAVPGGPFAGGSPMTVINLFPHAIFTGVAAFETAQAMPTFKPLPEDAELILEGTVGEQTTPLGWLRRSAGGRRCHLVPAGADLAGDPAYARIVAHAVRWVAGRPIPGARPIVQRTFMPDSYPGAFAITFPGGPGVCLDPVRGGINFIWDGDFVDLRPRWLTKQGAPARIFGPIFYQEKAWQPLRAGAPDRAVEYQFRGYAMTAAGPEFHYRIAGREVCETIRARDDGQGIVRDFRVGAGRGPLWLQLEAQPGAEVALRGLERDGDRGCFPAAGAGEFTIEIRRRAGGGGR